MIDPTAGDGEAEMVGSSPPDAGRGRPRLASLWILSAWCGLVAGLVEVGTIVLRKQVFDPDHLYKISRHFVWLIPLSNLCVFSTLGARLRRRRDLAATRSLAARAARVRPRDAARPAGGLPAVYGLAWAVVALGVAARLVPRLERHGAAPAIRAASLPAAVAIVAISGGWLWLGDRVEQGREGRGPCPPPGSPNVLLIVMDSVAAGHLGLHGYERATSTTLGEVAERGIRFESARAACSWTLPSHATMFTGRWMHELSVGWLTPLDASRPTLAEYLGDRGYATAGFVANLYYCAADSGLGRGFTHYRDFIFPELTALKTAVLVDRALQGLQLLANSAGRWLESAGLRPYVRRLWEARPSIARGRRWSIASSWTGSRDGRSRSGHSSPS